MYKIKLSPYHKIFYNEWKINSKSGAYNIVFDQTLTGNLNIKKLKYALNNLVIDNIIFNSHVIELDNELFWSRNKKVSYLQEYHEFSYEIGYNFCIEPFDLNRGPLYRFAVFKLEDGNFRIILVLHHLLIDGPSAVTLFNEISNYYNLSNYKPLYSISDQIKINYSLSEHLNKQFHETNQNSKIVLENLFQEVEAVDLRFLSKSTDKESQINKIREFNFNLNSDIAIRILRQARKNSLTPYILSKCIFAIILHKYTNQNDIIFSYPVTINDGKAPPLICGARVNINLSHFKFSENTTLNDLFNQELSLLKLLKSDQNALKNFPINKIPGISSKVFLKIYFAQTDLKYTEFGFKDSNVICIHNDYNIDLYTDITFEQQIIKNQSSDATINFRVKYNSDIIHSAILENVVSHYQNLVLNILEDLENSRNKLIKEYQLISFEEYSKIIYDWNQNKQCFLANKSLSHIFEEQVIKTPNNIAVKFEDKTLTYYELNRHANQLANYLRSSLHIIPEQIIAVCLDKSDMLIIAIIAILKVGAAYLPIDPSYTEDRLSFILKDSIVKIIITSNNHIRKLHSIQNTLMNTIKILDITNPELVNQLGTFPKTNYLGKISPNNLAYVIYTSGTTGVPKGVLQQHNNVLRLFAATQDWFNFNQNDVWLFFHASVFDFSIWEIWGALLHGGKLVIPNREQTLDFDKLLDLCYNEKLTILNQTPTAFYQFSKTILDNSPLKGLDSLRYIIFGGETLNYRQLKAWNEKVKSSNPRLINMYGITETTVHVTYKDITEKEINSNSRSIGIVIPDQKVYILDRELRPVPLGAIGELYIGGAGLARGYLNRPELNSEKFIKNPFVEGKVTDNEEQRIYKTGDLVRFLPNKELEYYGRNDSQVKIRGYRIELNEIENQLNSFKGITKSVILVKERCANLNEEVADKYLIGYFTGKEKLDPELIINYLKNKLPDYMVPHALLQLESFPYNLNGKVAKESLPEIKLLSPNFVKPIAELEILVCSYFSDILGTSNPVGIKDDFFKIGGNSILAIKLVAKLQSHFRITVNDLFNLRTPYNIIKYCRRLSKDETLDQKLEQIYNTFKTHTITEVEKKQAEERQQQHFNNSKIILNTIHEKAIKNVLLTGATGHLGCNILCELLTNTNYNIILFIRAPSIKEAYKRLDSKFNYYFRININKFRGRFTILTADCEKVNFGLEKELYDKLITDVDSIIHCAAKVKHYGEQAKFFQSNVQATINLLELAKQTRLKDFHYISSVSVLQDGYIKDCNFIILNENDDGSSLKNRNNIYCQTKFEGEVNVVQYRQYGVNSNIYRVGNLAMHSQSYVHQENIQDNAFLVRLKTFLELGAIPEELVYEEISPVDWVASAIIKIFNKCELSNETFHIFNPNKINLYNFIRRMDPTIKKVSLKDFLDIIEKNIMSGINNTQLELFMLHQQWLKEYELNGEQTQILIKNDKTNYVLSQLDFHWRDISLEMFSGMVKNVLDLSNNNPLTTKHFRNNIFEILICIFTSSKNFISWHFRRHFPNYSKASMS